MNDLAKYVDDFIYHNRLKKIDIANNLNISRQRVNQILNKKSFNIDDANYLLNAIGYNVNYIIEKQKE